VVSDPKPHTTTQVSELQPSVHESDSAQVLREPKPENELIESIYARGLDYRIQAHAAAEEALEHTPPESILRWEPVYIDPQKIVSGKFIGEDLDANSRTPSETIVISPFPDLTLHVSMTKFEDYGWGAVWVGEITNGGGGSVTIHLAPDEQRRIGIQGYIVTDRRNINLAPTTYYGHYVAVEMNPYFRARID
jgi:hypothetical protein